MRRTDANPEVELSAWTAGAQTVSAIKLVRAQTDLSLADAKRAIERCLDGESVLLRTASIDAAQELADGLNRLRFVAAVTYGNAKPHT